MTKNIIITEEEVKNLPNNYELGSYIRQKMNESLGNEEVLCKCGKKCSCNENNCLKDDTSNF
jgi:hypothetical protein